MFTRINADDIPRDRWGRPLIAPVDGGKPIPYTRVSTLAKALDDKTALTAWKCRQTAIGLATRADLVAKTKAVGETDKRSLDEVVQEALAAAASDRAANVGTALHAMTEKVDAGVDPAELVDRLDPLFLDLVAYREATSHLGMEAAELFVVCDELQAAGSFDRLVNLPGYGLVVADLKTGQHEPNYPHGVAQQIAIYAHGTLYSEQQGRIAALADLGVRTDVGLLIHLPSERGTCDLYVIDLDHGWALAQTAVMVRAA
ncbi:MAG TPA: hypothetical protein VIG24_08270 [Acidimicrobiia bacterium]